MAHLHNLEAIEHLIRTGVYMGPLNHTLSAIGGAGGCGRNPFDFMECVRRSPHGSIATVRVALADRGTVRGHGSLRSASTSGSASRTISGAARASA